MSYKKFEKNNFAGAWQNSEKKCETLKEENTKLKEENEKLKEEIKRLKHKYNNFKKKYETFMSVDIDEQIKLLQTKKKEQEQEQKDQEQQKRKKIEDEHKKKLAEMEEEYKKKLQQEQNQYELLIQREKIKMNYLENEVVNEVVNEKPIKKEVVNVVVNEVVNEKLIKKDNEDDNPKYISTKNATHLELFKRHNITKLYFRKLTITVTDKGYISDSDTTIYKSLNALTVAYFKLHSSGSSCNVWINVYFEKDGKKILIQNIRDQ